MAQTSEDSPKVVPLKPQEEKAAKPAKKTAKKAKSSKTTAKKASAKKATPKKSVKKTSAKKAAPKKSAAKKGTKAMPKSSLNKNPLNVAAFAAKPAHKEMEKIMTKSKNQFDQFTKEASSASKESVDAFVKSGTIFAKGFEEIIRETMSFAQTAAEKQMQFAKEAMSTKTINEFSEIQNKIAQTNFDDFMSTATKITELGTKVLTEAIEPINSQVTKSVQKATDAVAAE